MRRFLFPFVLTVFLFTALPAHADTLGQVVTFRSNADYDAEGAQQITATLQVVSDKAYIYVDQRYWDALSLSQQEAYRVTLEKLADEFDAVIYPRLTGFWGTEATPGVDEDAHITIAIEKMGSGYGGYFMSLNGYLSTTVQGYNQREMVYLSTSGISSGRGKDFLAHEFQHLISHNQKELRLHVNDDQWLNEARSEYGLTVAGYSEPFQGSNLQRRMVSFLRDPSDSLVQWEGVPADYSVVTLFSHYLVDRYGSDIIRSTISTSVAGVDAIDAWLSVNGKTERFPEVFADWAIASFLNDRTVGVPYGYTTPGLDQLHISADTTVIVGSYGSVATTLSLQEWEPSWTILVPAGSIPAYLEVKLSGQNGTWYCAAVVKYGTTAQILYCPGGGASLTIPTDSDGQALSSATIVTFHGIEDSLGERDVITASATLTANFTDEATQIIQPFLTAINNAKDGDLIRHNNEPEVYVVWGTYRRYLPQGVLELYGFQDRPVISVNDEAFNRYTTSNYVRAENTEPVYALWPDGTKHWLNITPEQWDASGRDWNAIFIINEAETNFYTTGPDITR